MDEAPKPEGFEASVFDKSEDEQAGPDEEKASIYEAEVRPPLARSSHATGGEAAAQVVLSATLAAVPAAAATV